MLYCEPIDHPIHKFAEFFITLVWIHDISIRVIQVFDGQVSKSLSEFVSHAQPQSYHVWRLIQGLLEVQGVQRSLLRRRHTFLKLDELELLCFRFMRLEDVISDLLLDLVWQSKISHGCICVVQLSLEFILSLSCLSQQIEVDSE